MPTPPTSSASSKDKLRWDWGQYWYKDALANRLKVTDQDKQIAVLKGQLTTATAGVSTVNLTPLQTAIAALDTKVNALTSTTAFIASSLPAVTNLKVVATNTSATIAWDYTWPTTYVTGFKLEQSLNGTTGFTVIATPDVKARSYQITGLTVGSTYYYRLRAYSATLAKDFLPSNLVGYVAK